MNSGAMSNFAVMLTGTKVYYDDKDGGAPSLEDIAVASGRIARFAGHTYAMWTDLHHAMVVGNIVAMLMERDGVDDEALEYQATLVWGFLHDAHEVVTADIPGPFKPPIMKEFQQRLDRRIWQHLAPGVSWDWIHHKYVAEADEIALLIEGNVLQPTGAAQEWGDHVLEEYLTNGRLTPRLMLDIINNLFSVWNVSPAPVGFHDPLVRTFYDLMTAELSTLQAMQRMLP